MPSSRAGAIVFTLLIVAAIAINTVFFVVSEMEQVIITEFGNPVGEPLREAGLYTKLPWRKATYFDRRVMRWDGDPTRIPTKDKKWLFVDATARWRIVEPLKFLQSVRDERGAHARLDSVVDSAVRESLTRSPLIEIVRSSNNILPVIVAERQMQLRQMTRLGDAGLGDSATPTALSVREAGSEGSDQDEILQRIARGRQAIETDILDRARKLTRDEYGIELIDVVLRRINYTDDVRENVYKRMVSERAKVADLYRSEGRGRQARILGEMERRLKEIESGAYREAREIEGEADAAATRITAEAFGKDAEFYGFLRSLEQYPETVGKAGTVILSTDNEYLKYHDGSRDR